jgi:transposase
MILHSCARAVSDTRKIERAPQRSREYLEIYAERQRERLAELIRANCASRAISEELHLSLTTVTKAKKMIGQGKEIPVRLPRGRPSKLTPEIVRQVHSATTEDPYPGSQRLAQLIAQATEMSISAQTANTIRKCLHFQYARARQCPLITQLQQAKRVKFCHECLTWDIDGAMPQVEDALLFSKGWVLAMSVEVHATHR